MNNFEFGYSIDLHNDTLVVGSIYEDSNQDTITNGSTASSDTSNSQSGAVWVFVRNGNNWSQQAYIKAANNDAPLSLQINSTKFLKGDDEYVDSVDWKKGISRDIKTKDGSYIIVDIHELLPKGEKALDDTKGQVISDYQNILEKEWLSSLKAKYSISINTEVLHSLIK